MKPREQSKSHSERRRERREGRCTEAKAEQPPAHLDGVVVREQTASATLW
jgi:hypothetical protein